MLDDQLYANFHLLQIFERLAVVSMMKLPVGEGGRCVCVCMCVLNNLISENVMLLFCFLSLFAFFAS